FFPRGSFVGFCLPAYHKSKQDRGIHGKGIVRSGIVGTKIPNGGHPTKVRAAAKPMGLRFRAIEKPYGAIRYYNVRFHGKTLLMQYICTLVRNRTKAGDKNLTAAGCSKTFPVRAGDGTKPERAFFKEGAGEPGHWKSRVLW